VAPNASPRAQLPCHQPEREKPNPRREWRDTVLVQPRERVEIAFIADHPGDWMFHCHVTDHQVAGMMAVIRIA
jgi:FtsP/CotA-like multicopper oxidase with cupredoxin domain